MKELSQFFDVLHLISVKMELHCEKRRRVKTWTKKLKLKGQEEKLKLESKNSNPTKHLKSRKLSFKSNQ